MEPIPSAGEMVEMLHKIRWYGSFVGDETVLDNINNIEAFVFNRLLNAKSNKAF